MKIMKNVIASFAVLGILGASGMAYAASNAKTPAQILSDLTGKSVESLATESESGKTYGQIANESEDLKEFQAEMLQQKKIILDKKVKDNELTQAQADEIYKNIQENQENCDGTSNAAIGQNSGAGFGTGRGMGNGLRNGTGNGLSTCTITNN